MLFPFANSIRFDPTQERVDRHAARRPQRLLAGLHVAPAAGTVQAALVLTAGRGKYLSVKHAEYHAEWLPDALRSELQRSESDPPRTAADEWAVARDLTDVMALAVEALKRRAGRFVDRILAVTVMEPHGTGPPRPDGDPLPRSCVADQLAELTGLNIIDGLGDRDIMAGGRGHPLSGWPLWLWLADRQDPVARDWQAALIVDDWCETFILPPSDGLDDAAPSVRWRGLSLHAALRSLGGSGTPSCESQYQKWALHMANGRARPDWLATWRAAATDTWGWWPADQQVDDPDLIRTLVVFLAEQVTGLLSEQPAPVCTALRQVMVAGASPLAPLVMNELHQTLGDWPAPPRIEQLAALGGDNAAIRPMIAALMGGLFIDQMPGNLPHLSGASALRCLGRLTPGTPARWRDLLTAMAEQVPTPMRLRDAI